MILINVWIESLDISFDMSWPENSPLPRIGELVEFDVTGGHFFMEVRSLTHQVQEDSASIQILMVGDSPQRVDEEESVLFALRSSPLVMNIEGREKTGR